MNNQNDIELGTNIPSLKGGSRSCYNKKFCLYLCTLVVFAGIVMYL